MDEVKALRAIEPCGSGQMDPLDVTDDDSIRRALDEAIAAFGGIDVLVNNAGIGHSAVGPDDDEDIESRTGFARHFGYFV